MTQISERSIIVLSLRAIRAEEVKAMINAIFGFFFDHPLVLVFIIAAVIYSQANGRIIDRKKEQRQEEMWVDRGLRSGKISKKRLNEFIENTKRRDRENAKDDKPTTITSFIMFGLVIYLLYCAVQWLKANG